MTHRLDQKTLQSYELLAPTIARDLASANRSVLQQRLLELFAKGSLLLELGCGPGAEAAALQRAGRNVIATDISAAMLKEAQNYFPELQGRLALAGLPGPLPFADENFDGIIAVAVLQHLPQEALATAADEITRILKPAAKLYLVTFDARKDLDASGRDKHGRLQNIYPSSVIVPVMTAAKLKLEFAGEHLDSLKRPGLKLREYVFSRME